MSEVEFEMKMTEAGRKMMEGLVEALSEPDDLYVKYRVFREPMEAEEHPVVVNAFWAKPVERLGRLTYPAMEEVEDFVFVLKPDSDPHARVAIAAYAESVRRDKPKLAEDLRHVLEMAEWEAENGG